MFLFSFYFKIKVQPKQFSFFFKTKHKFLFFLSISKSRNPKYQIVNHVTWNSIKNNRYIKNRRDHTTYLFFVYTMMKNNWKKWEGSQTNEKLNLNYLIETIISILLSSDKIRVKGTKFENYPKKHSNAEDEKCNPTTNAANTPEMKNLLVQSDREKKKTLFSFPALPIDRLFWKVFFVIFFL